jgi:DNA-binding transcriptional regulator GbsR (MarR family)
LSKGSASQGLRYLLDLGAARTVYVAGDRRVHYEAVAELRNLVSRFLHQQVFSYFDDSGQRLDRLLAEAKKLSGEQREFAMKRINMLKSWRRNSRMILPVLAKLLGGRNGD